MDTNIVLCADGTGNKGGYTPSSNVSLTIYKRTCFHIHKHLTKEREGIYNPPEAMDKRDKFTIITSENDRCSTTGREKKRFSRNVQKRNEKGGFTLCGIMF